MLTPSREQSISIAQKFNFILNFLSSFPPLLLFFLLFSSFFPSLLSFLFFSLFSRFSLFPPFLFFLFVLLIFLSSPLLSSWSLMPLPLFLRPFSTSPRLFLISSIFSIIIHSCMTRPNALFATSIQAITCTTEGTRNQLVMANVAHLNLGKKIILKRKLS